jgi:predicted nuclease of restriction endonuclease-like RecB superfamily
MLPRDLMIARKYRETLRPRFAACSARYLTAAEQVIRTFHQHEGARKDALDAALEALEAGEVDYRVIRGFAILVARRCRFEVVAPLSPPQVRDAVFQTAAAHGLPVTPAMRQRVLAQVAATLETTVDAVETSLYADLASEARVTVLEPWEPRELVQRYNVSLAQTLLFRAAALTCTVTNQWQRLFWQIKRLHLMYRIDHDPDRAQAPAQERYRVYIDGPLSLFRHTTRYGTNLARLLPAIIAADAWEITAQVQRRVQDRTLLTLHLDSAHHGAFFPPPRRRQARPFDSTVEQDFAQRFRRVGTGWTLQREPHPLPVGRRVMIPDFRLTKAGMIVYLEVAGFWTPGYLQHKLTQLEALPDVDMIIAADRALACHDLERLGTRHTVIYYRRQIPLQPILQHLQHREQRLMQQQLATLHVQALHLSGNVVTIPALAAQLGVLSSVVERRVAQHPIVGYHRVGDAFIADALWHQIATALQQRCHAGSFSFQEATELIEALGGVHATHILTALGYRIEWRGIDPTAARVHPPSS